ncbi:hypothetical protein [uncultured Paraglaciecola sp.]|uniref:hypothetical protein n=1 Tax=uncultured Paraglaciecola sp. TaxID=1765024 RepID=UPI0030DCCF7C
MLQYNKNKVDNNPKISEKPPISNIVIEQLTLPPVPKALAKAQTTTTTKSKAEEQPPEPKNEKVTQSPTTNQQQVQQVYQQLSDQGVDIQIAWPQNMSINRAALDFMYQCAGMQFAVLMDNNITKVNQFSLSNYSDWIRVAQGNLSQKEQHWLTAYALTGTPIRLFPREIDLRLAQHLTVALRGAPLVNLRANYQVTDQTLLLNNIQLNQQTVKGSWPLYRGKCG